MRTYLHRLSAILITGILLFPALSRATTTTILSQDFSGATFPPSGWTSNSTAPSNPNSYGVGTAWYRSSGGMNGMNGSAVAWADFAYNYDAYGTNFNGYYCGPLTLTTPSLSVTISSADTQYVDFDLWYPLSYYMQYYSGMKTLFKVVANGTDTVLSLSAGGGSAGDATFTPPNNFNASGDDPANFTSSSDWRHYHIALPTGVSSQSVMFKVEHGGSPTYTYWYTDNIAIDNVVITTVSHQSIDIIGPLTLNFGGAPLLQTVGPYYVKLADTLAQTINLSNYSITGPNAGDFTVTHAPAFLTSGTMDSIGVSYTPHTSGSESATLTVQTDDPSATVVTVHLTGTGLTPIISVPTLLRPLFAHVRVRFGDSAFATVLITNTGHVPLHVSPSSFFSGNYPQMYSIIRMPGPIGPDQTDSMIIAFAPTIEGQMPAFLTILSDASNAAPVLPLNGIGILARLDVNNSYQNNITMNFDSVAIGTDSCFQITLYNPGSDTLAIEKNFFSSADYDFSLTPLTGADTLIPPGGERSIQVCFQPLKRGYRTAELRILTNIPLTYDIPRRDTTQFTVLFYGTGVPTGNFFITSPDAVDSIDVGKTMCETDTLWNTGGSDLTVTQLTVDDTAEFLVTPPTLPLVLAAGTHQTFTVCATPNMMNNRTATVTGIAMNGEKMDTTTAPQDVFGISVCTSDSVTALYPATTCIGDTSTETIQITNCGNVPTSYTASLSGPNASDFAIVGPSTSSSEGSGGTTTFSVAFTPKTNTAETATLTIAGGAGATIPLSANGSAATIAGTGTAPVTAVESSSNFSVTVNNTGSCDWTPGAPTVTAPFSYVSGGNTAIPAGGTGTLNFTFSPTTAGSFTQPVTFPNAVGTSIPAAAVTISGTTSSASVGEVAAKDGYRLDQNYPNPFAGKSAVEITLPESSNVRLVVVDMKGEVVQSLLNQRMSAGSYEITLDASNFASGTYYYQMTAGPVTLTRQMVVLK